MDQVEIGKKNKRNVRILWRFNLFFNIYFILSCFLTKNEQKKKKKKKGNDHLMIIKIRSIVELI